MAFNKSNTKSLITSNQAEPPFPHNRHMHMLSGKVCILSYFLYFCYPYPDQILTCEQITGT